ncbi:unnamed protein product, partial [Mesorhabditis spiculigera]
MVAGGFMKGNWGPNGEYRGSLIAMVQERRQLWDLQHYNHRNHHQSYSHWADIAKGMSAKHGHPYTAEECRKVWRHLFDSYRRTLRKTGGDGRGCRWEYFDAMNFLKLHGRLGPSRASLPPLGGDQESSENNYLDGLLNDDHSREDISLMDAESFDNPGSSASQMLMNMFSAEPNDRDWSPDSQNLFQGDAVDAAAAARKSENRDIPETLNLGDDTGRRHPSSKVWKHFQKVGAEEALCRYCREIVSVKKSSTTQLHRHLSRMHHIDAGRIERHSNATNGSFTPSRILKEEPYFDLQDPFFNKSDGNLAGASGRAQDPDSMSMTPSSSTTIADAADLSKLFGGQIGTASAAMPSSFVPEDSFSALGRVFAERMRKLETVGSNRLASFQLQFDRLLLNLQEEIVKLEEEKTA